MKEWVFIKEDISAGLMNLLFIKANRLLNKSPMPAEILRTLFKRDLTKLKSEIELYTTTANLWISTPHIANSAGNLCLHLIGNLNTYIGANLGGTGYIRNRELEFSSKDIPKEILLQKIEETILVVDHTLSTLTAEQLVAEYPFLVLEQATSTQFLMIHLVSHLSYHLGQINYHRRLLDL